MEHIIHSDLLVRRVRTHLVGVGGNGAQMANCLARLDIAIRAMGHPHGLHLTAYDPDKVSAANVGRQVYGPADVGQFKALLAIHRLNTFYGLDWDAEPRRYGEGSRATETADIVISCVDSAAARRAIHKCLFGGHWKPRYWLDLGNTESSAQVVLGEPAIGKADRPDRLPCVTELYPQLMDMARVERNEPSCSVAVSLESQGLFVNDMAVRWGAQLLYELFTHGRLLVHGVVANLATKRCGPIAVDAQVWERFGVKRS